MDYVVTFNLPQRLLVQADSLAGAHRVAQHRLAALRLLYDGAEVRSIVRADLWKAPIPPNDPGAPPAPRPPPGGPPILGGSPGTPVISAPPVADAVGFP